MRSLWPCSDSSRTPSFPSQLQGKIGLPRANPRGSLKSLSFSHSELLLGRSRLRSGQLFLLALLRVLVGTERFSSLPKVTEMVSEGARVPAHSLLTSISRPLATRVSIRETHRALPLSQAQDHMRQLDSNFSGFMVGCLRVGLMSLYLCVLCLRRVVSQ